MTVSRRTQIGIFVGSSAIILLAAAYFIRKNQPPAAPAPAPLPVTVEEPTPVVEAASEVEEEAGENSCDPKNTFGEGEKTRRTVPADLQFRAQVSRGDPLVYSLPFALKVGEAFALTYNDEDSGYVEVAQCRTEDHAVRCNEVFTDVWPSYCGSIKLADGSEKFVQFFLEINARPAPLPADLDPYATKKEAKALGLLKECLPDPAKTAATGLPAYLPIQIWESSDPSAKMIGEVPSGFLLLSEYSDAVYIDKVGDRYLTNLLAIKPGEYNIPQVFHWISNVQGVTYEEIIRSGGIFCLNFIDRFCKNPSEKDCQDVQDSIKGFSRWNYEADLSALLVRNESDWVLMKPKTPTTETLPPVYVPLQQYIDEAITMCD
jgi:hypothetical protein